MIYIPEIEDRSMLIGIEYDIAQSYRPVDAILRFTLERAMGWNFVDLTVRGGYGGDGSYMIMSIEVRHSVLDQSGADGMCVHKINMQEVCRIMYNTFDIECEPYQEWYSKRGKVDVYQWKVFV